MKRKLNRKGTMIPVRLEAQLVKELDLYAIKNDMYRSEVIREAIKQYLNKIAIVSELVESNR